RFKSLDPQDLIELIDKIDKKLELDDRQKNMLVNFTRGKNSTLQSIEQKEKTEYRYIGGYLTKLADKVEFNYQLNRFVTDEIAYYDKTLSLRKIEEQTLNQFLK
ncbi:MAG TPA: ketopantoate reductase C-terminal domain-containing protein, partial [Exilispira sp.]|nr:ketopantoate reductase C-terminal domain-containing protein [Exilispira sp.]